MNLKAKKIQERILTDSNFKDMMSMVNAGKNYFEIATFYNDLGYRTKSGLDLNFRDVSALLVRNGYQKRRVPKRRTAKGYKFEKRSGTNTEDTTEINRKFEALMKEESFSKLIDNCNCLLHIYVSDIDGKIKLKIIEKFL